MGGKRSILLPAVLLLGVLAACHGGTAPADSSGGASSSPPQFLGPDFSGSGTANAFGLPFPELEMPEPTLKFDPDYTLEVDFPKVSKGALELPVQGATGYASVQLPLWEEIPEPKEPDETEEPGDTVEPGDPEGSGETEEPGTDVPPGPEDGTVLGTDVPPGEETPPEDGSGQPAGDTSAQAPEDPDAAYAWLIPDTLSPGGQEVPAPGAAQPGEVQPGEAQPGEVQTGESGEVIYPPGEEPLPPAPEPDPEVDPFEGALAVLDPGTPFLIRRENEEGDWWYVQCKQGEGWIENRYCLINLPDVVPSMVYNATNSYQSRFMTLGREIPNVTGRAFYPGSSYNGRLERDEFMMPVLYSMSKRICQAQQAALAQGNTLVLYEGYRPHSVQTVVYKALSALSRQDSAVKEAVTGKPWNLSWFIAGGYSNHQRGFAIDVTLAQVQKAELQSIGGCPVLRVLEYEEYTMPTPIHELSRAAATFTAPVASHSPSAWRSAQLTGAMGKCEPALALQRYCTGAGLTPLASEWWHFNDLETRTSVLDNLSVGGYKISACLSTAP